MVTTKWGGQTRRPRHSAPRTSAPATADASRNACTRNTKQAGDENGMKGGKGEELELGGRSSTGDNTRPCVRGAGDVSLAPLPAGSAHNQSAATSKRRTTRAGHAALTAPRSARCARAVLGARWGGGGQTYPAFRGATHGVPAPLPPQTSPEGLCGAPVWLAGGPRRGDAEHEAHEGVTEAFRIYGKPIKIIRFTP